ncbi:hypothetical protein SDC9_77735 [bioreactor metagenome]|uniref:Uncharacterized protein n=1 Tax=bioreactor metagenome TaxID=1076179 RepID=A0A644YTI0_9ZZZZ
MSRIAFRFQGDRVDCLEPPVDGINIVKSLNLILPEFEAGHGSDAVVELFGILRPHIAVAARIYGPETVVGIVAVAVYELIVFTVLIGKLFHIARQQFIFIIHTEEPLADIRQLGNIAYYRFRVAMHIVAVVYGRLIIAVVVFILCHTAHPVADVFLPVGAELTPYAAETLIIICPHYLTQAAR